MQTINPKEFQRLVDWFEIKDVEKVLSKTTYMVPTNITYYPMRGQGEPTQHLCPEAS